jgi:hypothetical protein
MSTISWWPECVHWPFCPGVFIAILAFVAAGVTLREKPGPRERAVWLFVFLSLMFAEVLVMSKDRTTNIAKEKETREAEIASFKAIGDGIQNSIALNQSQFSKTMAGIKENVNAVTGGNTYCYVMASPVYSEFGLNIFITGKSPLHEVSVAVIDIDWMKQVIAGKPSLSYEDIQSFTMNFPIIPFLTPGTSQMLARIPIGTRPKRNLQITFSSLNGIWSETLKLELVNGKWAQALKVGKVISPVRGGTPNEKLTTPLYTFATDTFPKRDGKVDWDN